MSINIKNLVEEIKKNGVNEPHIEIVTPEIRTIDEKRLARNVKVVKSEEDLEEEK